MARVRHLGGHVGADAGVPVAGRRRVRGAVVLAPGAAMAYWRGCCMWFGWWPTKGGLGGRGWEGVP